MVLNKYTGLKYVFHGLNGPQQSAVLVPVDILDLRSAVAGTDVSGQHLEGGGLARPVLAQQTKALEMRHKEEHTEAGDASQQTMAFNGVFQTSNCLSQVVAYEIVSE